MVSRIGRLTSENYIDLLEDHVFPVLFGEFPENNFLLMHDRAPAHTSLWTRHFLQTEYPDVAAQMLPWPPKGADLNPIENIWAILAYGVSQLMRMFGPPPEILMICGIMFRPFGVPSGDQILSKL